MIKDASADFPGNKPMTTINGIANEISKVCRFVANDDGMTA